MTAFERLGLGNTATNQGNISENQHQTDKTFGFKWAKRETYESPASKANMRRWLIERYCSGDDHKLDVWLGGSRKLILDAGCGAGFSGLLFFGDRLKEHDYLGVDISSAVDVAKSRFVETGIPGDFLQCDLSDLPIPDHSVDIIFSEGVLHHTDSTEQSLKYLAKKLVVDGRMMFYVYRKKAVIREYTDDYIRNELSHLDDESAWEKLKPLTKLGIALGKLNVEVCVEEDIPMLGIQAGKMDLQRFFYWNICKAYYRQEFDFDEMHHINFDWFRPLNCHRHTPEEVQLWCEEAGLQIEHMDVQEAGITVVARKEEESCYE